MLIYTVTLYRMKTVPPVDLEQKLLGLEQEIVTADLIGIESSLIQESTALCAILRSLLSSAA
jgi:hypothetical protein